MYTPDMRHAAHEEPTMSDTTLSDATRAHLAAPTPETAEGK